MTRERSTQFARILMAIAAGAALITAISGATRLTW